MNPLPCEGFTAALPPQRSRTDRYSDRLPAERWDIADHDEGLHYRRAALARPWALMRLGVTLLFWGLLLSLVTLVAQIPLQIIAVTLARTVPVVPVLAITVLGLLRLAAAGMVVIGVILCCTIPSESKARGWAIEVLVTLGLTVAGVMLLVLLAAASVLQLRSGAPAMERLMVFLVLGLVAVAFAGSLCFTMVLRAAACFWNDRALGRNFVTCFVVSWVLPFLVVVFLVAVFAAGIPRTWSAGLAVTGAASIVAGLLGLALLIWFLVLLHRLRQRIPAIPRAGNEDL
jgi:hypothetical protein